MTLGFGLKVLLEVVVTLVIVYGVLNEERLIKFEDKLLLKIRKRYTRSQRKIQYAIEVFKNG